MYQIFMRHRGDGDDDGGHMDMDYGVGDVLLLHNRNYSIFDWFMTYIQIRRTPAVVVGSCLRAGIQNKRKKKGKKGRWTPLVLTRVLDSWACTLT